MIIWWWWFFFFSFVSLSFSFSPNCWHNTTTKFRAAEHTHIYIYTFTLNIGFASSHNDQPPLLLQHLIVNPPNVQQCASSFSFICCYSNCKESNRVCIYLRCAMNLSLENEWLFHRYKPLGYIHRCHHTYIYTHSIGVNRKCLFLIPHAPIPPLHAHIYTYIYHFLLSLSIELKYHHIAVI
jgi:hypothetical protein